MGVASRATDVQGWAWRTWERGFGLYSILALAYLVVCLAVFDDRVVLVAWGIPLLVVALVLLAPFVLVISTALALSLQRVPRHIPLILRRGVALAASAGAALAITVVGAVLSNGWLLLNGAAPLVSWRISDWALLTIAFALPVGLVAPLDGVTPAWPRTAWRRPR